MNSPIPRIPAFSLALAFFLLIVLDSPIYSQIVIRERASINPKSPRQLATLADMPASEARIVADYSGTLQITQLVAYQTESHIASNAYFTINSPLGSGTHLLSDYCSYHYWGQWYYMFFNTCTHQWVWEDDMHSVGGIDRTIFVPVNTGDTVQFGYWSNGWAEKCSIETYDTCGKVVLYSLQSNGCYTRPDLLHLEVYYSYADSGFSKLGVEAYPDTVIFGDSLRNANPIAVTAKSASNREVVISEDMLIQLAMTTIPSGADQCFGFISTQGDTLRTSLLQNVRYGDARSGKIRVVATSKPPDTTRFVQVEAAPPPSTGAASGVDSIVVAKPSYTLRLSSGRQILRPIRDGALGNKDNPLRLIDTTRPKIVDYNTADTTRLHLSVVSPSGNPAVSYSATITSTARPLSGGHAHTTNRPGGRFITATNDTVSVLNATTDSLGYVSVVYLSSGIGGQDSIAAHGTDPRDTSTFLLSIRDANLSAFPNPIPGVSHYTFTGSRTEHPDNHYARQSMRDNLPNLIDSAFAYKGYVLQLNDMSLIWGGPFDCAPSTHPWDTPHQTHREGRNVDLSVRTPGNVRINDSWLRYVCKFFVIGIGYEGNPAHYHLTF